MRRRLLHGQPPLRFRSPRLPAGVAIRQVRALQLRKLRRTIAHVRRHVPYYRSALEAAGVRPEEIRSLDDLRHLPLTHRADLEADPGRFLSAAPGLNPTIHLHTSGTSGRPLDLFLSQEEFDYYVAVQAMSGMAGGFLGPAHILQVHLSLDTSIAARIFTAAAQRAGALVLNIGVSGEYDRSLRALFEERHLPGKFSRVSGLFASPGQLWALTTRAEQLGLSGAGSGLRRIYTCGAMVSENLKRFVHRVWGLPLREAWSMVETLSTGAFECESGRLHFLDLSGLVEFLDPETRRPVPPGRPGVAVVTAFYPDRELMPILRYWSHDLMVPSAETACECGVVSTQIEEILGRTDQMVIVGARNFFPQALGEVLRDFPGLVQPPRFRVAVQEHTGAQHVVMEIECAPTLEGDARPGLNRSIREALPLSRDPYVASGTVRFDVSLVPAGSIRDPFRDKGAAPGPEH